MKSVVPRKLFRPLNRNNWPLRTTDCHVNPPLQTEIKPAPPIEKIKVKVDGREIEVPKTMPDPLTGKPIPTTMIQACELAKTEVPALLLSPKTAGLWEELPHVLGGIRHAPRSARIASRCWNPDGTPKIAKMPRPAISCATPISPGMEIYTQTPGVKQMREGVLESLLINHPLDCPICDQAGECKLQEYSVDLWPEREPLRRGQGSQAEGG